jgi:hypothetical protein
MFFFVLDGNSFWFILVNQETFEIKIQKRTQFTFLVIFHFKVGIYPKFNLSHIYGHSLKKPHL